MTRILPICKKCKIIPTDPSQGLWIWPLAEVLLYTVEHLTPMPKSQQSSGSNPSILWHSGFWGAADEAELHRYLKNSLTTYFVLAVLRRSIAVSDTYVRVLSTGFAGFFLWSSFFSSFLLHNIISCKYVNISNLTNVEADLIKVTISLQRR